MMCEYLSIDLLYMKLMNLTLGDIKKEQEEKKEKLEKTIYSRVEQEFGRTLSPIECETIKGWIDGFCNNADFFFKFLFGEITTFRDNNIKNKVC